MSFRNWPTVANIWRIVSPKLRAVCCVFETVMSLNQPWRPPHPTHDHKNAWLKASSLFISTKAVPLTFPVSLWRGIFTSARLVGMKADEWATVAVSLGTTKCKLVEFHDKKAVVFINASAANACNLFARETTFPCGSFLLYYASWITCGCGMSS